METLTPQLITLLFSSSSAPRRIPCTVDEFLSWRKRHEKCLGPDAPNSLGGKWEYNECTELFIIRCMPTPIHARICGYAPYIIYSQITAHTGLSPGTSRIVVSTDTDVEGLGPTGCSQRRPDLLIQAPTTQNHNNIRGFIMEIGFSHNMDALIERAQDWFTDVPDVNIVVLVNVTEPLGTNSANDNDDEETDGGHENMNGDVISPSRFQRLHVWPGEKWLVDYVPEEATFEKEFARRLQAVAVSAAASVPAPSMDQEALVAIKQDLMQWLLDLDHQRILQPPLVNALDGVIYIYTRETCQTTKGIITGTTTAISVPYSTFKYHPASGTDVHIKTEDNLQQFKLIFTQPFLKANIPLQPLPATLSFTFSDFFGFQNSSLIPPHLLPYLKSPFLTLPFPELGVLVMDAAEGLQNSRAMTRASKIVANAWEKLCANQQRQKDIEQVMMGRQQREDRLRRRTERKLHQPAERNGKLPMDAAIERSRRKRKQASIKAGDQPVTETQGDEGDTHEQYIKEEEQIDPKFQHKSSRRKRRRGAQVNANKHPILRT